uniref:Transmembrane protein 144 n=1 Tax=Rhabditophanes sp. KR3021 TaxID=114890 RepID=A0AC35TTU1_9BILA
MVTLFNSSTHAQRAKIGVLTCLIFSTAAILFYIVWALTGSPDQPKAYFQIRHMEGNKVWEANITEITIGFVMFSLGFLWNYLIVIQIPYEFGWYNKSSSINFNGYTALALGRYSVSVVGLWWMTFCHFDSPNFFGFFTTELLNVIGMGVYGYCIQTAYECPHITEIKRITHAAIKAVKEMVGRKFKSPEKRGIPLDSDLLKY